MRANFMHDRNTSTIVIRHNAQSKENRGEIWLPNKLKCIDTLLLKK